ncbi:MAG TPA: ferrochelatase, partial [Bacteroidetes bacterium]|nr:ferrochelatase [Bacteroidota bacterium]HEX03695.1 ferrochelatase [Bacteroidota bacterium]
MSVKQALVLVNMGGPASTEEIAPYMRAIFADPFILPLPWLLRGFVSNKIVKKRTQPVIEKYNLIGGKSPLLKWTEKQVKLMRRNDSPLFEHITHAYRYTSPTLDQTFASLKKGGYQSVTILPMFPHSSRAMTGSIEHEAKRLAKRHSITTYTIDAWGLHKEIIALQSEYLKSAMDEAGTGARVLFVAHGIPMREVKRGDNYPDK